MATAYYKVILFMNHPRGGWSETYYTQSTSVQSASTDAFRLAKKRGTLLAPPSQLVAYRVGEEGNPRNTELVGVDVPNFSGIATADSDTPWQAVLLRMSAVGTGYKRPLYIRGIPDRYYDVAEPVNLVYSAWLNQLNNVFRPELVSGSWWVKGRQKGSPTNKVPIVTWDATTQEDLTLVGQSTPSGLKPGDFVQIYKLKGLPQAPGLTQVAFADPALLTFKLRLHTPLNFLYAGNGYYIKYAPAYNVITSTNLGDVVHRDTGRPFGEQRGRRRAIRR